MVLILVMGFPSRCLGSNFEADPYSFEVGWSMFMFSELAEIKCFVKCLLKKGKLSRGFQVTNEK